jgi:hypothetical protein
VKRLMFWVMIAALLTLVVVAEVWPDRLADIGIRYEPRSVTWAAVAALGVIALTMLRRVWCFVSDRDKWI